MATGDAEVELLDVALPTGCEAIWLAFTELHATRPSGMGASGISWQEIAAWQELNAIILTPWEIGGIMAVDLVALKFLNKKTSP